MESRPTRIVLTGDVFRTSAGERNQLQNVRWLERRFAPLVSALTGIEPEIRFRGGPPFEDASYIVDWYRLLGERPGIEAWARTFWMQPPAELIEALAEDYAEALVISIELSPLMELVLNALGVPWIDVGISPLRFLPDFAISFRMSSHFTGAFPVQNALANEEVTSAVTHIRAHFAHDDHSQLDGAMVFFGQTEKDRTLIKEGRFAGAKEAIDGLADILDGRRLLVKPHPWARENPVVGACMEALGGVRTEVDTYSILSSRADVQVATISSSVGTEAKAFGVPAHIFHDQVQHWAYAGPASMRSGRSVEIWGALLSRVFEVLPTEATKWRPNELRRELGSFGLDAAIWDHE